MLAGSQSEDSTPPPTPRAHDRTVADCLRQSPMTDRPRVSSIDRSIGKSVAGGRRGRAPGALRNRKIIQVIVHVKGNV